MRDGRPGSSGAERTNVILAMSAHGCSLGHGGNPPMISKQSAQERSCDRLAGQVRHRLLRMPVACRWFAHCANAPEAKARASERRLEGAWREPRGPLGAALPLLRNLPFEAKLLRRISSSSSRRSARTRRWRCSRAHHSFGIIRVSRGGLHAKTNGEERLDADRRRCRYRR